MAKKYVISVLNDEGYLNKSFQCVSNLADAFIFDSEESAKADAAKFGVTWHPSWILKQVIQVDPDIQAAFKDRLDKMLLALNLLNSQTKAGALLTQETVCTVLDNVHYRVTDLGPLFGVSAMADREAERIYGEIRAANATIHELEAKLLEGGDLVDLKAGINHFVKQIEGWWSHAGFGYVREVSVGANCARIRLSGSLSSISRRIDSATPVSDKAATKNWYAQLEEQGFVLVYTSKSEPSVLDCTESRQALKNIVDAYWPGAKINSIESKSVRDSDNMYIYEIELLIWDYAPVMKSNFKDPYLDY